ncbi:MAG TPA: nuclear transport factor 2 family protein [Terriglobales bacterium]|jgi:ketosteroid isomerase-like protein
MHRFLLRSACAPFLVLALLFTICPGAGAAETADETKILALENAWNQAQIQHDATALSHLLPESFIYTDYDGTIMNKAEFLKDLQDPAYQASLVANENVKVYAYSGAAIVVGTYHTRGKYKGKPFEHWGRFTDTWVFQNNLWQCVASHTSLIKK